MVTLARNRGAVVVFGNLGVCHALVAARIVQAIFFGSLRPVERERLSERMWYTLTESLLAATIFRKDFDLIFAVLFGLVLFLKAFHWLVEDRIEYVRNPWRSTTLGHSLSVVYLSLCPTR